MKLACGVIPCPSVGVDACVDTGCAFVPVLLDTGVGVECAFGIDAAVGVDLGDASAVDVVGLTIFDATTIIDCNVTCPLPLVALHDATTIIATRSVSAVALCDASTITDIPLPSFLPVGDSLSSTINSMSLADLFFFSSSRSLVRCDICHMQHIRGFCRIPKSFSLRKNSPVRRPLPGVLTVLRRRRQKRLVKRLEKSAGVSAGNASATVPVVSSSCGDAVVASVSESFAPSESNNASRSRGDRSPSPPPTTTATTTSSKRKGIGTNDTPLPSKVRKTTHPV